MLHHADPPDISDMNLEPALAALAKQFMVAMHLIQVSSRRDETLNLMNESGLTVPQMIALHALRAHGAQTVGDIADETQLSKAATSHLVDRLVVQGLVTRVEDERDRRQKNVSLTPKAVDLTDRLYRERVRSLVSAFSSLTPGTRDRLTEAMAAACRELGGTPGCCEGGSTEAKR